MQHSDHANFITRLLKLKLLSVCTWSRKSVAKGFTKIRHWAYELREAIMIYISRGKNQVLKKVIHVFKMISSGRCETSRAH